MNFDDLRPYQLIPYGIELMNKRDYRNAIIAFDEGLKHIKGATPAFICRAFCKLELLVENSNIAETEQFRREIESDLRNALSSFLGVGIEETLSCLEE